MNYITGYMEKLKFGLIKRDFKSKQWVGGKIMICSPEMLYSDCHVDI